MARCALVLGDIPTLRELWDGAALFVPPDDPDAARLGAERARRGRRVARACSVTWRGRGLRAISAARMTAGYLDAYAGLLAARSRAAVALAS